MQARTLARCPRKQKEALSFFNEGLPVFSSQRKPFHPLWGKCPLSCFVLPVPRGTNVTFLYCERQFSRLIASGFDSSASVSFPVSQWIIPLLAKYGDEFVQDSHLLPFSPDTYVRHPTHRYLIVFSLTTVSVAHRLFSVKCRKIRKSGHFPFHIPHPRRSSWTLCAIRAQWFSLLPILSGISE